MSTLFITADVKPEHTDELEEAATKLFAALEAAQLDGVKYASARIDGTSTYAVVLQLDDPNHNPMVVLPEFVAYQESLKGWLAGPPTVQPATVVGSYRLF